MNIALQAIGLSAGYGRHAFVHDVDITVCAGQVVALLGPNGAGKTTTLLALAGHIAPLAGTVEIGGRAAGRTLHANARRGLAFIGESRSVFHRLTVAENLRIGRADVDRVVHIFPELKPLLGRRVGLLSGGEQQMLTVGRALTRSASVVLVDELSLGLAPLVVQRLLAAVREAADGGVGVLMVEQHVEQAMSISDHVYVMNGGQVRLQGAVDEVRRRPEAIREVYLSGRPSSGSAAPADEVPAR